MQNAKITLRMFYIFADYLSDISVFVLLNHSVKIKAIIANYHSQ